MIAVPECEETVTNLRELMGRMEERDLRRAAA